MSRVLFILKHRDNYEDFQSSYDSYGKHFSSGLFNSCRLVTEMLSANGVECKLVQVVDNNSIDKEVHDYKPTHVIIEALWVVPDKFDILHKLHPTVTWIIRLHSELPFLSNESIAMKWIREYVQKPNVIVASNSLDTTKDLRRLVKSLHPDWPMQFIDQVILYLPNFYPIEHYPRRDDSGFSSYIHIGAFGAIRPLKNQLIQAVAAIEFANLKGKALCFHINGTRNEQGGASNIENIRALFKNTKHRLVEHPWLVHKDFLSLLNTMDVSMNVSFTETFNIIAADSVAVGVPMVTSPEITWSSGLSQAPPTSASDIVKALFRVTGKLKSIIKFANFKGLKNFSDESRKIWLARFK